VLIGRIELRHQVDISAGMARYGWTAYDTREGGTQTIEDVQNKIDITTEFIKKSEGASAGNWALRVRGTPRKDAPSDLTTIVVFYVGMESMDTCSKCKLESSEQLGADEDTSVHAVNLWIEHPTLGTAGLHIPASMGENGRHEPMVVKSLNVSEDKLWQARCKLNSIASCPMLAQISVNYLHTYWLITLCGESYLSRFFKGPDQRPCRSHPYGPYVAQ
jgi:mannosyl-oligosaccharide glucosidase